MKTRLTLLLIISTISTVYSQEKEKIQEVGMSFRSMNNYGLVYRIGNTNSVWRVSLSIEGNEYEYDELNSPNYSENFRESFRYYLALGKELRKSINERIEFRYGADLFYSNENSKETYSFPNRNYISSNERERTVRWGGLNLLIGFNYLIGNNFVIGLEINPHLSYQESEQNQIITNQGLTEEYNSTNDGYSYGFNQEFALVSILYRFSK